MHQILGASLLIIWSIFALMLTKTTLVNNVVPSLLMPSSWNEYGDALGSINGILSIASVWIAMHAVAKQGRQIDISIKQQLHANDISYKSLESQINSNKILIESIIEQQKSNKITTDIAIIDYIQKQNDILEENIKSIFEKNSHLKSQENKKTDSEYWDMVRKMRAKIKKNNETSEKILIDIQKISNYDLSKE
ncbi:hypothetical protein GCM10011497_35880 [Elstera cyanobacteriorum]|uniref:hypothetical protein n=1 Tax=Elstera cyanobacteriorum TaxID=2022747 RepID=UPI00114004EE|nr:hypothetical protein [Elstera cyanobacteriorum]GGA01966.1 hypothetical protein GCM10011497_35880 [Elstera cyanobacteriorum]